MDAGHGGKDPGKVAQNKYKEKDIALDIVLKTGQILQSNPYINVIFTRKTDVFVDLWERGRIANKADADLFVSVHCNAHNSQAHGAETWVMGVHANERNFEVAKAENEVILLEENYEQKYKGFDPSSPESVIGLNLEMEEYLDNSLSLASLIQNVFKTQLRRSDRGVKQAGFVVLHQTYMPSVLIETGFLSNKYEGAYLNSNRGKSDMAKSIAKAIETYVKRINLNAVKDTPKVPVVVKAKTPTAVTGINGGFYAVQVAAGKNKISTRSRNFKGLKNITRIKYGGVYRYYYGKVNDVKSTKSLLAKAKKAGYKQAFVVGVKADGERFIP